ncbi:MAG: nucleotidyltransferase family protein, partial [bacterium]|nr:nucleotidyltransferase family protein [bacterium]
FLKGPALAALLYGDISSRHTGDIDVLVESRDIEAIHELLSRNEYQTGDGNFFLSPAYRKAFSDANHHIAYSHKRGVVAEFHYRLFRNPYIFPLSPGDSPLPYRDYTFPGATIRLLPDIEHFLFLFVHGAIHKWRSLKWLIDIARLLDSPAVFDDWERLFDRAREMGVERMVIQGLLLAKWLLDCPFPPAIAHHITGHKGVKLAFDALNELDGRKELPKKKGSIRKVLGKIFYRMKLRKGLKYKLYNLEILFSINSHNQKLMLPSYLYPFRFLLSPLLLGYRRCFKRKKT